MPRTKRSDTMILTIPGPAEYPNHLYAPRHIEVKLTEPQARAVRRLQRALELEGERCNSSASAVAWLIGRLEMAYRRNSEAESVDD